MSSPRSCLLLVHNLLSLTSSHIYMRALGLFEMGSRSVAQAGLNLLLSSPSLLSSGIMYVRSPLWLGGLFSFKVSLLLLPLKVGCGLKFRSRRMFSATPWYQN